MKQKLTELKRQIYKYSRTSTLPSQLLIELVDKNNIEYRITEQHHQRRGSH